MPSPTRPSPWRGRSGCAAKARSKNSTPAQVPTSTRSRATAWLFAALMHSRQAGSTRGSVSTAWPTSSSASGCARVAVEPSPWPVCPSSSTSTGCGNRRSPVSASGSPTATCTASSTAGAIGKTSWSANRIRAVDDDYGRLVGELHARRKKNLAMGGAEKVDKQHQRGKLTVRERLELLYDPGTFVELGLLASQQSLRGAEADPDGTPADGVVTGHGEIEGRQVWVIAYDFTVMAGSMGAVGEQFKAARVRELALRYRKPIVWLLDSAGARIQEAAGSTFAGTGWLFAEQVVMSGVIPQVAGMRGPGAAGTACIPGPATCVPMVKDTSSMALGGARLVKAATGEDVTDHDMGGSQVHCYESGVGDNELANDAECIATVRRFLSYLPSSNTEPAPFVETGDPRDRLVEGLEKIVPVNPRAADDVRKEVTASFDPDSAMNDEPTWTRNLVS